MRFESPDCTRSLFARTAIRFARWHDISKIDFVQLAGRNRDFINVMPAGRSIFNVKNCLPVSDYKEFGWCRLAGVQLYSLFDEPWVPCVCGSD